MSAISDDVGRPTATMSLNTAGRNTVHCHLHLGGALKSNTILRSNGTADESLPTESLIQL